MSLKGLADHINDQEEAISKLFHGIDSETIACTEWREFRDSLWGRGLETLQGEEKVERDRSIFVDDVALPEKHIVATLPYTLAPDTPKILVRSEYDEVEQEIVLSSKRHAVFVVSGQPGIGKSTFLRWLLVRRLALKLPTVYHPTGDCALLFYEDGILELTRLGDRMSYRVLGHLSNRIWALIDSGPGTSEPAIIFKQNSPFFIVYSVSLHSEHLGWLDKLSPRNFYMSPWSISEVLQARPFLGNNLTEDRLKAFYNEYSSSPRTLVDHSDHPDEYAAMLWETIDEIQPGQLRRAFYDPGSYDFSHLIVTIWPSLPNHDSYRTEFASWPIAKALWQKRIRFQIDDMEDLYRLFHEDILSPSAAWIFKFRMHELLRSGQTIGLFPILRSRNEGVANLVYGNYAASRNRRDRVNLALPVSSEYPLTEEVQLEEDRYYHSESSNFAVDSLLLIHPPDESPILLMFQMTVNDNELGLSPEGLDTINRMLPGTRKYYVVVTPEAVYPKVNVPAKYFKEREKQVASADEGFLVFHYSIRLEQLFAGDS